MRNSIRDLRFFVFCFMGITGVGAAAVCLAAPTAAPIRIGVNLELTGPWANITKTLLMAMEMEAARVNEQGGVHGRPIELVVVDNGFDLAKVSANMLQFADDKEVLAVIGPFEDTFQATTRAIAERKQILNLIVCPSNPAVRAMKQRWAFNIAHNDRVLTEKLIDLCLAKGYKTLMVCLGNWPLAKSLADNFKAMGEKNGLRVIISEETHKPADVDMTPQIIKMQPVLSAQQVDAIYLATGGPPGPIFCKNLRSLGIDLPVLGTHAFGFGFVIALGGGAVEGVTFPAGKPVVPYQMDENDPVRQTVIDFQERMKARYGIDADQIAGHGYDIVWLLSTALARCGKTLSRSALRDALEKTQGFNGCTGVYSFSPEDHDGLHKSDMVFVRIRDGKFERVRFDGGEAAENR